MKNTKLVVAAFAALTLTAGQALAQSEEEGGDPCGGGEEGMGGDPCGGGEEGGGGDTGDGMAATSMDEAAGGEGLAGYPQAVIDRPRVLPKGVLEATVDLPILIKPDTAIAVGLAARYGLAPKLDAQLSYGFSLKEFEIKGDLGVAVQYSLAESDKLGVAARVTTGYSVVGEAFDGVGLGVNLQYKITPKISVFTPGDQITMGGADFPKPVSINLPVGFGFQANEKIWAWAATSIGTIGLSPSGNTLISDLTPVQVGASFSPSNKLDVGATLDFLDVQHAGDFFGIGLHAAIRM